MRKSTTVLLLATLLATPGSLLAHAGHHHVMGTISAMDAAHIQVRTKDGKSVSVPVGAATKYFKGKAAGSLSDAKVGARVVVDLDENGKAEQVHLSSGAAASKPVKAAPSKQK
jgi:hypothetical protein